VVDSIPRRFALLLCLVFAAEVVAMLVVDHFWPALTGMGAALADAAVLVALLPAPAYLLLVRPLVQRLRTEQRAVEAEHHALGQEIARRELDGRLYRALDMAETEGEAIAVLRRAICEAAGGGPAELLLADSSNAHLRQAAACESEEGTLHACDVGSPRRCPAARHGRRLQFDDSRLMEACPRMSDGDRGAHAAVCLPVSAAGRNVGVLRATGPVASPPSGAVPSLEVIAAQAGARLGMLRAMKASALAATTDPLTGLCNRRSLEDKVGGWLEDGRSYAVVMADLDHFKELNDTHSHAAGDRALKTFARTLARCCRPDDVVARMGGEEFVVALPLADSSQAAAAMERVRTALVDDIARAGVPTFTASFGIADSLYADDLESLLKVADEAMYAAKRAGRDRVVIAGAGVEDDLVVRSLSRVR